MKLLKIIPAVFFLIVIGSSTIASPISEAQQMLNQLSYNAGSADGAYGKKTRKALEKFYRDIGGIFDGKLDDNEISDLKSALQGTSGMFEAQLLLQRFSYVQNPPSGVWSNKYKTGLKQFYRKELNKSHNGKWSPSILQDLRKRKLIFLPQTSDISHAEETFDVSHLGFKKNFKDAYFKKLYNLGEIGFTAIASTETAPPFCYPTPEDCTENKGLYSPNPHNAALGDFNGDGLQDLAIAWIYFTHTTPRLKTPSHIRIYLNDGQGALISSPEIYAKGKMPLRHFMYRMTVSDFNNDGIDDIFSGSMGVIKRVKNIGNIHDYEPHVLLLSDGKGKLRDASNQIEGQEKGGLAMNATFAHTSTSGDIDCDGDIDIYAGGILLINDGNGNFTNDTKRLPKNVSFKASPPKGASLIFDTNNDGCGDLITFDFNGAGHLWQSKSGRHGSRKLIKLMLQHDYGSGNMQVNNATFGDIDGDGLLDAIVTIHRKNPYYQGRRIIIFHNKNGKLVDTSAKRITDVRDQDGQPLKQAHGEGSVRLIDHDNDGDLDIIDSHGGSFDADGRFGMSIFENDGEGKFTEIPQSQMVVIKEQMIKGFSPNRQTMSYAYPINLDNKGILDYVSFILTPWTSDTSAFVGYTVFGK